MLETGQMPDPSGQSIALHSNVSLEAGLMLQKWLQRVACINAVEVGLAFGVSSLFILEELEKKQGAQLYGIDPMQFNDRWHGLGLENIKRAGFDSLYNFYPEPSYQALPKMVDLRQRIQFALIDGWHTFDYALVDFFYIDKMLDVNGVIAFDDVGYKAIRKTLSFVLSNLEYRLVDGVRLNAEKKSNIKSTVKSKLAFLSQDDWTPSAASRENFDKLEHMQTVVIQKMAEDSRSFRHFLPF